MADEIRRDAFQTQPAARLNVHTDRGDITIAPGAAGSIEVESSFRWPQDVTYHVREDGNTVTVEAFIERHLLAMIFGSQRPRCDIRIKAPRDTVIDLHASSGSIDVSKLEGGGALRTANGRVTLADLLGNYEVRTSNGKVTAGGITGALDAQTSNGIIDLEEITGPVRARTSNGAINAHLVRGMIDLRTSNGPISALVDLPPGGTNFARTSNGGIEIDLMGSPDLRIDVKTSSGGARVSFPGSQFQAEGRRVNGQVGAGSATLHVRTSNGRVRIGEAAG